MIIIRISGGLGNQMFQYALGRALSIKNNTELALDISSFSNIEKNQTPRTFRLKHLNIKAKIANKSDFEKINIPDASNYNFLSKLRKKIFRLSEFYKPIHKRRFIIEKQYLFDKDILNAPKDCFITGVWQSEKYFKNIEKIIRKDFALKKSLSEKAEEIEKMILEREAVSIHIRRGDYISNKETNQKHGTCSIQYYAEAIRLIKEKLPKAQFFIFSDDISWVKTNIKIPDSPIFVSTPEIQDFEEIILMSICKHNIIANSSFSWWGAWLNNNSNKIVIAPQKWFLNGKINKEDLIPSKWLKI